MKKVLIGSIVMALVLGFMFIGAGCGYCLTLGSKVVASDKKIINTTIHTANTSTEVSLGLGSYIKRFEMREAGTWEIRFMNSASTTDAYITITSSKPYISPMDVEMTATKEFYITAPTVPCTLETIYWYR